MDGPVESGVLREDLNFRGLRWASHKYVLAAFCFLGYHHVLAFQILNYQLWQLPICLPTPPFFVSFFLIFIQAEPAWLYV